MADFDAGFKIAARSSGAGLSRLAGVAVDRWEPIGDTLQTTERLADRAFRATADRRRFIVYMEAYTRWVESAPWSVLAKSGLLSERERLPTCSLLFILLSQGYKDQNGTFRLEVEPARPTQQVWFEEVCLWRKRPEPWWEYPPGLMSLYPLCDHGLGSSEAVGRAADAIRRRELDSLRRADLLATLGILARLADRTLDALTIIGRKQMRDSPFYQQLVDEGKVEMGREAILQVLRLRFGKDAAEEFSEAVNRLDQIEQLQELHKIAVQSRRISQFRRAMASL